MGVAHTTLYTCDVPACPVQWSGEGNIPAGWANVNSASLADEENCDCDCHSCAAGDEMDVAGHEEEDCGCQNEGYSWFMTICPSHSDELKRRFR